MNIARDLVQKKKTPKLSKEERRQLCRLAQAGSVEARNTVVLSMLPWVKSVMRMTTTRGILREDLYDLGLDALYEAIGDFDCSMDNGNLVYWCRTKLRAKFADMSSDLNFEELDEHFEEQLWDGESDLYTQRITEESKGAILASLECLNAEKKELLTMRFGLDGRSPMKFREIAEDTGLSIAGVSGRIKSALECLAKQKGLKGFEYGEL